MNSLNTASLKECATRISSIVSIIAYPWRSHLRIGPIIIAFTQSRPYPHLTGIEVILDNARITVPPLTYFPSAQMFEPGAEGTIDVMILAGEAVLSVVVQRVEFVAPFPREVEPWGGSVGCSVRSAQRICDMVVRVCEGVESGIPEWAAIGFVVKDSEREDVRV